MRPMSQGGSKVRWLYQTNQVHQLRRQGFIDHILFNSDRLERGCVDTDAEQLRQVIGSRRLAWIVYEPLFA
jgi:hypothetical protein